MFFCLWSVSTHTHWFLLSTQMMKAPFLFSSEQCGGPAMTWRTCSVLTNYLLGLAATPPDGWKKKKNHMRGNLLSFQHKCGARNDQTLTSTQRRTQLRKVSLIRDITTGSSGGAKRQQQREISVNIHAVMLIPYFRSAAFICCSLLSFRWRFTVCPLASCWPSSAYSIFWWWRILSSSVGCNRF